MPRVLAAVSLALSLIVSLRLFTCQGYLNLEMFGQSRPAVNRRSEQRLLRPVCAVQPVHSHGPDLGL
jgi:hypothetical protein